MTDSYYASYRYPYYSNYYPRPSDLINRRPISSGSGSDVDRTGSLSQLAGSFSSGGGYEDSGSSSGSCFSLDICPDLILAAIALAAAVAAFVLYQTITMAGRRRKREADDPSGNLVTDLLWLGRNHLIMMNDF